ncbi:hypothetical protein JCM10213_005259 [Rhodosporidiobolus nylandii]
MARILRPASSSSSSTKATSSGFRAGIARVMEFLASPAPSVGKQPLVISAPLIVVTPSTPLARKDARCSLGLGRPPCRPSSQTRTPALSAPRTLTSRHSLPRMHKHCFGKVHSSRREHIAALDRLHARKLSDVFEADEEDDFEVEAAAVGNKRASRSFSPPSKRLRQDAPAVLEPRVKSGLGSLSRLRTSLAASSFLDLSEACEPMAVDEASCEELDSAVVAASLLSLQPSPSTPARHPEASKAAESLTAPSPASAETAPASASIPPRRRRTATSLRSRPACLDNLVASATPAPPTLPSPFPLAPLAPSASPALGEPEPEPVLVDLTSLRKPYTRKSRHPGEECEDGTLLLAQVTVMECYKAGRLPPAQVEEIQEIMWGR